MAFTENSVELGIWIYKNWKISRFGLPMSSEWRESPWALQRTPLTVRWLAWTQLVRGCVRQHLQAVPDRTIPWNCNWNWIWEQHAFVMNRPLICAAHLAASIYRWQQIRCSTKPSTYWCQVETITMQRTHNLFLVLWSTLTKWSSGRQQRVFSTCVCKALHVPYAELRQVLDCAALK